MCEVPLVRMPWAEDDTKAYEKPLSVRGIRLVRLCKCGDGTLDKLSRCGLDSKGQDNPRPAC